MTAVARGTANGGSRLRGWFVRPDHEAPDVEGGRSTGGALTTRSVSVHG